MMRLRRWLRFNKFRTRPQEHASAARARLEGRPQFLIQLSNSPTQTCVIARCKLGAGPPLVHHVTSTSITTPEKGEQCTERTVRYQLPRLQVADPHPVWIWSADRLSAHRGRDVSKRLFGDLHRTHPLGLADATCSVLCATNSPVGARAMQLPHFRLPPALAGLRLLLRSYPRSSATRNRFPQALHSRSVSGLSSRNAPCENGSHQLFCLSFCQQQFRACVTNLNGAGEIGANRCNHTVPITRRRLAKQTHAWIPGTIGATQQPSPIRAEREKKRRRLTERSRKMRHARVDGNDPIHEQSKRRRVLKVGRLAPKWAIRRAPSTASSSSLTSFCRLAGRTGRSLGASG